MNKRSWEFYVLTNKEKSKSFSKEIADIAFEKIKHISKRRG
jgi:hypothetical protein